MLPSLRLKLIAKIGVVCLAYYAATELTFYLLEPQHAWPVALAMALFIVLASAAIHQRNQFERLQEIQDDVAQIEPLFSLFALLKIRRPLPLMQQYAIAPDFAVILHSLMADQKPRVVVETGSGVSTLIMAYCLKELGGGKVLALDHDAKYAEKTRREIERHGLSEYATVVHAPLRNVTVDGERYSWYTSDALESIGAIDMVIDDGPPKYVGPWARYASLPTLLPKLTPNALFVLDYVAEEENATIEKWLRKYPEFEQEVLRTRKGNVILRRTGSKRISQ